MFKPNFILLTDLLKPSGFIKSLAALSTILLCSMVNADNSKLLYRFAVFGDTPYFPFEYPQIIPMMNEMTTAGSEFIVHVGDFKSGISRCSNELFENRWQLFNTSKIPFIFVPGDNEWLDCQRERSGSFDPLERLNLLRKMFYKSDPNAPGKVLSIGQKQMALASQALQAPEEYPEFLEHLRWQKDDRLFITLNVTGSNNGIQTNSNQQLTTYLKREKAVADWLDDAMNIARKQSIKELFIFMQADPRFDRHADGRSNEGFGNFLQRLESLLDDAEPMGMAVYLIHGDTHKLRIDKPLQNPKTGKTVDYFTRVETYGAPTLGWVEFRVYKNGQTQITPHPFPQENIRMTEDITISERHGVRYLHFGSEWIQGAMRIRKPQQLVLEYTSHMCAPLLFKDIGLWPNAPCSLV